MKRIGTVLVFREDVTPEQAAEAVAKIADVLDLPEETYDWQTSNGDGTGRVLGHTKRPYELIDGIHEYDDEMGGPVWYIP